MYEKARELAHELIKGNYETSWKIVHEHSKEGFHSTFIYDLLLKEAMHYIGYMWQENEITVAEEHLATGVCDYLLSRYSHSKVATPAPNAPKALFFCVEGELHYLGLKMVSLLFQENGWDVRFLGPNLPLEYATYSVKQWKPDLVGISLSLTYQLPHLSQYIENIESLPSKPTIMVGSRLVDSYHLQNYCSPRTVIFSDLEDISVWLKNYQVQYS
ncbi:cobalamin-binding protein [Bacillus sp. BGMRC 2118]|nr:cobalamin-binding protein [Bacillus sp. BGMRC 2118]